SERPDFEGREAALAAGAGSARVAISDAARQAVAAAGQPAVAASSDTVAAQTDVSELEDAQELALQDPKLRVLISMIEALTGRKVQLLDVGALQQAPSKQPVDNTAQQPANAAEQRVGWGLEYDRRETVHEFEQTSF